MKGCVCMTDDRDRLTILTDQKQKTRTYSRCGALLLVAGAATMAQDGADLRDAAGKGDLATVQTIILRNPRCVNDCDAVSS